MVKPTHCPVCGSRKIELKEEEGLVFVVCHACHFDEAEGYDEAYPGERSTQKGKTRYTPYKRGGGYRTRKTR